MDEGKKWETIGFRDERRGTRMEGSLPTEGGGAVASVPVGASSFATSVQAGEGFCPWPLAQPQICHRVSLLSLPHAPRMWDAH
jgi:hypothetical protein